MKFVLFIFCSLVSPYLFTQNTFSTTLGERHPHITENGCNIFALDNSTYIIANNYLDTLGINGLKLINIDEMGNVLWEKRHVVTTGSVIKCLGEFIQTKEGGFAFSAYKYRNTTYGTDGYLMEFNHKGELLWQKSYGNKQQHERTLALRQLEDEGYVLTGFSSSFDFDSTSIYTVRTDKFGKKLWEKYTSAPKDKEKDYIRSYSLDINKNGEIVIGGLTAEVNFNAGDGIHHEDGILIKLDSLGNEIWRKYYETRDELNDCDTYIKTLPAGGGYIVWGCERYATSPSSEAMVDSYFIQQLTEEGDTVWTTFLDDGSRENGGRKEIENIQFLADGNLLIIGTNTVQPNAAPRFGYLAKYTANGSLIWERTFDFYGENLPVSNDNFFYDVAITPDNGFMVSGRITFYGEPSSLGVLTQVWLLRLDSMGCLYPDCTDEPIVVDIEEVLVEELKGELKIVPNPSKGNTTIYFPPISTINASQVKIYSILGALKEVYSISSNQSSLQVNTFDLESGLYLLSWEVDGHILKRGKMVVE